MGVAVADKGRRRPDGSRDRAGDADLGLVQRVGGVLALEDRGSEERDEERR